MSHFARRTLSLLLAIVMVVGMLPMSVFATETETPEQTTAPAEVAAQESSEPVPSEEETPQESSEPAPSESEEPQESSEPAPSESEPEETTLPTETQEDAPKGRTATGENKPYLTLWRVAWDEATGRYCKYGDEDDEIGGVSITAGAESYWIFYYNTYNVDDDSWTSTPVIPDAGNNLVVTPMSTMADKKTSGTDAAFYVGLRPVGTLDPMDTYVSYNGVKFESVSIGKMIAGFFTSATPSWDTYIQDGLLLDASKSANEFYWIYRGLDPNQVASGVTVDEAADVPANVTLKATGSVSEKLKSWFGEDTNTDPLTLEKVSDKVYKITVNPSLVTLSKYDDNVAVGANITYTALNVWGENSEFYSGLVVDADTLPYAEIEINNGSYQFYKDGAVWYSYLDGSYVTVPVSVDGFAYEPDEEIKLTGVSYDYASNTLTLNNAHLDTLRLNYAWGRDGETYTTQWLPNADLTLKLVGSNTISKQLNIALDANVTLVGYGTLTVTGEVTVSNGCTLDMDENHILLNTGGYYADYGGTIMGEFWYVEGYTDLRMAWLSQDDDGCYYLPEDTEFYTTAMCAVTAEQSTPVVFRLYTWKQLSDDTYGWDVQPVIPTGGDHWTVTPITENIQSGATDSGSYVMLLSKGILGGEPGTLTYGGVTYSLYVAVLNLGFYSAPEWDIDNVLPSQDDYNLSAGGKNTIYMVSGPGSYIKSIEWGLTDTTLTVSDYYTATELESGAWQIDFTDACLERSDLVLYAKGTIGYNEITNTNSFTATLRLIPPEEGIGGSSDTGNTGDESGTTLAARFTVCIDGDWYHYEYYTDGSSLVQEEGATIIDGFSYDQSTNTLTLTNVTLTWFDLMGGENLANENLTLVLAGTNAIGEMSVNMGANLTIRGEGTLDIGSHLYVDNNGHLTLEGVDKVYLPNPSALRVDTSNSTVTGTFSYREGASFVAVRGVGQNEDGFYLESETYLPIDESGIMGMQEMYSIFYSCEYSSGEWVMTPVVPEVASGRLSVTECTDVTADGLTDAEKACVVKVKSLDLGGYGDGKTRAYVTIGGEDYDFTVYDLHIAYYSCAQPTPDTYLEDDAQHFFYSDGGSFYCIIRTTSTGIKILGDVTWKFNTWGQDYSFIPGIGEASDLVVIEDQGYDDNGNRVFKITPSKAYVDFMSYGYNWKNFSIAPVVTWEYTGNPGETGYSDYWDMWINPPTDTQQPEMLLNLGDIDYQFYADGAVYYSVIDGDYEYKKLATLPDGVTYDGSTNTLTLDGADMPTLVMRDDGEICDLNIHVASNSTISGIRIHGENTITVTCNDGASLTVTEELSVFDATTLTLTDYAVTVGKDCEMEIWGTLAGELAYAEGYAQLIVYSVWDERLEDENGNAIFDDDGNEQYVPTLHGPYTLEEHCLTGMYSENLLFYTKVMGNDGEWVMKAVKPESDDLEFAAHDGSFQHEDSGYLYVVTSNTLGDHRVELTVGEKTWEWYVAPTPAGYFSAPEATVANYLKGDSQHFFDTTLDGDNTFYFIALAGHGGYTLNGDITSNCNTWGQDYAAFMGLDSNEELVTITPLADDANGNKVWRITASQKYIDYVKYSWNWRNFELNISASWTYSDGNSGGGNYGMWISPPLDQEAPKAAFCINNAEYFIYADAIFCRDWNDMGYFVKITEEDYPKGVSYDVATNTMTLEDADLEMLYLEYNNSWEDEDGTLHESYMLPTSTVTLNLEGVNTLKNDYAHGIQLAAGANLKIIGGGSLEVHVTNTFESNEEGGYQKFSPVYLSEESNLTIDDGAQVTLINGCTSNPMQESLSGIYGEGGISSLVLKENATLNIYMDLEISNESYEFLPFSGLYTIAIRDNAYLSTDGVNLMHCEYSQTGGTWKISPIVTNIEDRIYEGLHVEDAALSISGGLLSIECPEDGVPEEEDFTFYGIRLTGSARMNVSGGEVDIHNGLNRGCGIAVCENSTLEVSGGTIDLLSDKKEVQFFNALTVENACVFQMHDGTINADGRIFALVMEMDGGEINLTGMEQSELLCAMMVMTGKIEKGKINLKNAIFSNNMNFSIDGGTIDIQNTNDTTGLGQYETALVGLSNELYLPINGGTITIQTAHAAAIGNRGTFHQMGGSITAVSETIGVANSGTMLLNSGTMEITAGDRGVNQWYEEALAEAYDDYALLFQVGGGVNGNHKLTITGGNLGLVAQAGQVHFTGDAQVSITIPEDGTALGEVAGIKLYDTASEACPAGLTIEGAANVDIQCLLEPGIGLSSSSPVSIIGNQEVCPTISIAATYSAVCFGNDKEEIDLLTMEGLSFVSADGKTLNTWSHEKRMDYWFHYLLEGDTYATNVTTEFNSVFAEFTITPYTYRITEQGGQQVVEVKEMGANDDAYAPGELPDGVAYDLASNTMTLSNKEAINYLWVSYLTKDIYGNEKVCLPSQDFTIQLANKNVSIYMLSLDGQINATITGSGTLKLMDSSSILGNLTIAKGVTLVNNVSLSVYSTESTDYRVGGPASLTVEKGATLTNKNLLMVDGQGVSTLDVQGKFNQDSKCDTWVDWAHRGNVNIAKNLQTLMCDITSEAELTEILAEETLSSYKHVRIYVSSMELTGEHNIPKNTSLRLNSDAELTIADTAKLTIAGTLVLDEYSEYGTCALYNEGEDSLHIAKGGSMTMDGNFYGYAPVNDGGKITPQATKLAVTAEDNVTSFDLYGMDEPTTTLTVNITTKEKTPLNRVTWKSSNEKVVKAADIADNQDGTYTVTFAGGVGKVTLTATTIDGAKKTAKITLTVAYLDGKLTATQEDSFSTSYLQVGETATMAVSVGEVSLNELNEALDGSVVTFKSGSTSVAEVDPVTGVITGKKTGSAKITATMAIPGDTRSVSITVKVVVPQILELRLAEGLKGEDNTIASTGVLYSYQQGEDGNTTFNLADFGGKAKELYIFPEALTWNAEGNEDFEATVANKLKWTSSDTSIATVKSNKDYATVTVKAKAHGTFTITATATDTNKAVTTMTFVVMDYTPRLSNPSITLNPKEEAGVKLDLLASYGNNITGMYLDGKNADSLAIDPETYYVKAVQGDLKNQTIKPTLHVVTEKGEYEIALTVTVKSSSPKITATQYNDLNLTYRYSCTFDLTSSIGEVYDAKLAEDSSPDILLEAEYYYDVHDCAAYVTEYDPTQEYWNTNFYLRVKDNCGSKINTKVKLKVYVTGYQVPIDFSFTPTTTTEEMDITVNPTSSILNGNADLTTSFTLQQYGGTCWLWSTAEIDEYGENFEEVYQENNRIQVVKVTYNNTELPFEVVDSAIQLTFEESFTGKVKVEVRHPEWTQHKTVTHQITTSTKDPTVIVDRSPLNLYTLFTEDYNDSVVRLNQCNLTLLRVDDPVCTSKTDPKLDVRLYMTEWRENTACLEARVSKDEDGNYIIPEDGTYTYSSTAYYLDPVTGGTKALPFTFKVKAASTSPTIKLTSNTIKLNTAMAGVEVGCVYDNVTLNDVWYLGGTSDLSLIGYEIDGHDLIFPFGSWDEDGHYVEPEPTYYEVDGIKIHVDRNEYDGYTCIVAELTGDPATKHTYTVYPIVEGWGWPATRYTLYKNKLSLTVQPHSSKVSVTQSTSGKLDLLTPDTPVVYTITKLNNAYGEIAKVTLLKKDGDEYVPYETDEEPLFDLHEGWVWQNNNAYQTVELYLNPEYTYTAAKKEQFKLRYTIFNSTYGTEYSFDSSVLSLQINRSTPTITAPTVNYYQAEGIADKTVQLSLTKPVGASIGRLELNEGKTSKELLAALGDIDMERDFTPNGDTATLDIRIADPSALKAGKSYYLYLDVYPATPLQTAEKSTTVKVTVKVAK